MTNSFLRAYKNLIGSEGGYSNNKNDKGGETYKGISRVYNPNWEGWELIDRLKNSYPSIDAFKEALNSSEELEKMVQKFYYEKYWNKFKGDFMPYMIAEELLEQSVVLGTWRTAGKQLQKALNLLNRNGKLYPDLVVDGLVGVKTLQALDKVQPRRVLKVLNGLEFCRFKESMEKRPVNEIFVGWFDRV